MDNVTIWNNQHSEKVLLVDKQRPNKQRKFQDKRLNVDSNPTQDELVVSMDVIR